MISNTSISIGMVFAALLHSVARNPSLRGQLFSYAILGFAFVEAIGLFDLMVRIAVKVLALIRLLILLPGCHDVQVRLNEYHGFSIAGVPSGRYCNSIG